MRDFFIDNTGICFEFLNGLKRYVTMPSDCNIVYELDDVVTDIAQSRQTAMQWLNEYIDNLSDGLLSKYSKAERDTFAKKQKQAKMFLAGDFSDCAMLSAECAAMGHTLDAEHCQTILSKAAVSDQLWGFAFGLRQALDIELQQCLTVNQIQTAYDAKIAMIDVAMADQAAQQAVAS